MLFIVVFCAGIYHFEFALIPPTTILFIFGAMAQEVHSPALILHSPVLFCTVQFYFLHSPVLISHSSVLILRDITSLSQTDKKAGILTQPFCVQLNS